VNPALINDEAAEGLDEAIRYYATKSPGIGLSLADKVSEAFNRIQRNPKLYPFHQDTNVQKCIIRRFPCAVFYIELDVYIVVIAVAHQRLRPDYWKLRQTSVSEESDAFEAYGDRKP
jgi:toxin ParE1/3/4